MIEKNKIIGERLAYFRKQQAISQKELANITGISRSYITNVETGAQTPSFDFLEKLSNSYNISLDWLILGRGQMNVISEDDILNKLNDEHIKFLEKLMRMNKEKQTRFLNAFHELTKDE